MKTLIRCGAALVPVFLLLSSSLKAQRLAPAYPLIVHDPYFSVWSFSDTLTATPTRHWTGKPQRLSGIIEVDKQPYRFIGDQPEDVPAAIQQQVELNATQTLYTFSCGPVALRVVFTSPLLMEDLDLLSRPVTYVDYTVHATDGGRHEVVVELSVNGEIAADKPDQPVKVSRYTASGLYLQKGGNGRPAGASEKGG